MGKKISPNNLAENRSESRNIPDKFFEENYGASKAYHIPLVDKEVLERDLYENFEPFYFYKGAVLSLLFCLPFWIILFKLITWLLISSYFLKLGEVKRSNYLLFFPKVIIPHFHPYLSKSENFHPKSNPWFLAKRATWS